MVWLAQGATTTAASTVPVCANGFCQRSDPGDGPTCRWHVRNYGTESAPEMVTLCNACKINFDQQKYCPYCLQIYKDKDPDGFDGKEWVACVNRMQRMRGAAAPAAAADKEDDKGMSAAAGPSSACRRWVHLECEEEVTGQKIEDRGAYLCPSPACRPGTSVKMRGVMATKRARAGGPVVRAPKHTNPGAGAGNVGEGAGSANGAANGFQPGATGIQPGAANGFQPGAMGVQPGADGMQPKAEGLEEPRKENRAPNSGAHDGPSLPELPSGPPRPLITQGRRSRRKKPALVNLARLQTASLRKYKRAFNLSSGATKQELQDAVSAHFASSTVTDERETLSWFVLALSQNKPAWRDGGGVRERNG